MTKVFVVSMVLLMCSPVNGQVKIKTTRPCTDEVLFNTPGRWLKTYNGLLDYSEGLNLTAAQKKEIVNRLDAIHQMMLRVYPQPKGLDAAWHHSISYGTFAEQVKYEPNSQGTLNRNTLKEKPVAYFNYTSGFFRHYCIPNNPNEIFSGYPGETNTWIYVNANTLGAAKEVGTEDGAAFGTIGGYPVCQLQPLIKKIGNFELLGIEDETANISTRGIEHSVIVHRNGMLPYIPVTRKQYLERCISYFKESYDKGIKSLKESPLPFDDKDNRDIRDNQISIAIKNRNMCLTRYQDELNQTTREGLLEAPAIVQFFCSPLLNDEKIFVSEKEGWTLVIQNPDYMRKDLPKYVPQFFVVNWRWDPYWRPQTDIAKLIEERFPFENLQAMIDK